jgi:hypothetical protein
VRKEFGPLTIFTTLFVVEIAAIPYFVLLPILTVGMLQVSRYIHLNPIEAKMVKQPAHYPWSSFYLYLYPNVRPARFMNIELLLDYYIGTKSERRRLFCKETTTKMLAKDNSCI